MDFRKPETIYTILLCFVFSLIVMTAIDYSIGDQAEFINAWSVVERFSGKSPSAGNSLTYDKVGQIGEAVVVATINLVSGFFLAWLISRLSK